MDPFLDLIRLLRPQATIWAHIKARGRWGVAFRQRDDLLFCWVERGSCFLVRPQTTPLTLHKGDFALLRTSTPFTLTSDPSLEPEDSETIVAATGHISMNVGEHSGARVLLRGGRFFFNTANEQLLLRLLPQVVHVAAGDHTSSRLRTLLSMNETESASPGAASEFVIARLMELILVEILRSGGAALNMAQVGILAGLVDPVIAPALMAMHREVARPWTVDSLARLCGASRSGFSARFSTVMGIGPIGYLQQWRIALAKDELCRGARTVAEIALSTGFQSASAFSTAFSRAVGFSPRRFAYTFQDAGSTPLRLWPDA